MTPIRNSHIAAIIAATILYVSSGASDALAAGDGLHVDGAGLGLVWLVPFVAILAGIAIGPLAVPHAWHAHYGKYAVACALAFLVPCALIFGIETAAYEFIHTLTVEYIPFIVLLLALYVTAGGICLKGSLDGTPVGNTALIAVGTALASIMGTTGACMLLIQPLLRANAGRARNAHVFVFFIFLVGNIGGALTPLGDPPLFIGFLEGVAFFWVTRAMLLPMLFLVIPLLAIFYLLDRRIAASEPPRARAEPESFRIDGKRNLILLAAIIAAVLVSGVWRADWTIEIFHTVIAGENVVRTLALLAITGLSLAITPPGVRIANGFEWGPIAEVAKIFIGIFVTIIPAIAIVRAGTEGGLADLVALLNSGGRPNDFVYFWVTGVLSGFLDNAPTYLLFFNLAGGDPATLMGALARTLLAISTGAVFMGALTYIGNAPNFMVKAMAERKGVRMPSFFGYVGWSTIFLLPLFVLQSLIFFA
ncbi:MAG: sodium:proton antiporter [Alphaproteobacteria bacterium]|nr:sodium:proton antiporter [Alphaproteobacteria bacterium]